MGYEQTLEKVILRLDREEKEKDKRIAELEKEANNTKGLWVTSNDLQAWKLEQQAKGVEGYIAMRKLAGGSYCSTTLMYIDELYEQAKALKESK
tara:strand:- start:603 stop:884 length:282 start_codon:yes stop_codon:yes gene_type:complete